MKTFVITLTILFPFLGFGQQVKKTYYDIQKSRIKEEYQVNSSGEKNGYYKGFDENGVVVLEYNFQKNLLSGACKEYSTFSGRKLAKLETYKNGVLHGPFKQYGGKSGTIVITSGNYVEGNKDGEWLYYQNCNNCYGLPDEVIKTAEYYIQKINYDKGNVVQLEGPFKFLFYPSGKTYLEGNISNGKETGVHKWYFPDGKLNAEKSFDDNGKLIYSKSYYHNGQLQRYVRFENGKEVYEGYEEDGSPDQITRYEIQEKEKINQKIILEKKIRIADSTLMSGNLNQAIELYNEAKITTHLLIGFNKSMELYKKGTISLSELDSKRLNMSEQGNPTNAQIKYCKDLIQKEVDLITKRKKLETDIQSALNLYNKNYGAPFNRSQILYDKSWLILNEYLNNYNNELDPEVKSQKGEVVLKGLVHMNSLSEEKCRELKKQLKKIEDLKEIKQIIGIE